MFQECPISSSHGFVHTGIKHRERKLTDLSRSCQNVLQNIISYIHRILLLRLWLWLWSLFANWSELFSRISTLMNKWPTIHCLIVLLNCVNPASQDSQQYLFINMLWASPAPVALLLLTSITRATQAAATLGEMEKTSKLHWGHPTLSTAHDLGRTYRGAFIHHGTQP